jgi:two-component system OmpR family sensor kinase
MKSVLPRVRDVRTRLFLIVVCTVALALAAGTLGYNVLLAHTTRNNINTLLRQRVDSERSLLAITGGRIHISESRGDTLADSRVWIFAGHTLLERPPARPATDAAVASLAAGPARFVDVKATDERLYAAPLSDEAGRRVGTIIAGISIAPYEATRHVAVAGSLVFAIVLMALVAGAAWWLLRSALQPVARMTDQAAAWSEHELDRRFDFSEPHDELTRLAATLNGLLDRIAASLRHERRFSAEMSHEIRTPLSNVIAEAELALRRERTPAEYTAALGVILRNAQQVSRTVDALVAAARHEASSIRGTADAYEIALEVTSSLEGLASELQVELRTEQPTRPLRVGVDADLAVRALHPVVENACRYGRSAVTLSLARNGNRVTYLIQDDGPGITGDELNTVFEPGVRGRGTNGTPGAGLGLALARRIARAASGEVDAVPQDNGATFTVSLPAA